MKKIKKIIIEAVDYLQQNSAKTITEVAKKYGIDRHTLSEYQLKSANYKKLFESVRQEDKDYLFFFSSEEIEIINYYKENSDKISYRDLKIKYPKAPLS